MSESLDSILLPQHLADLRRSGLSDEQILRCRFRSSSDAKQIAEWLKWTSAATVLGPCLAIPFYGPDTKLLCVRIKPDKPRKSKPKDGGKPIKYESPVGAGNRAYVPPGTRAALADASLPMLVTEGEKKAAKADQEGFACIGLVGVYGWQKARPKNADGKSEGPRELIPDLAAVAWRGAKSSSGTIPTWRTSRRCDGPNGTSRKPCGRSGRKSSPCGFHPLAMVRSKGLTISSLLPAWTH